MDWLVRKQSSETDGYAGLSLLSRAHSVLRHRWDGFLPLGAGTAGRPRRRPPSLHGERFRGCTCELKGQRDLRDGSELFGFEWRGCDAAGVSGGFIVTSS